ncbi:MAG: DegT/DnrJ/EryC1/StrS family aminotransferase [Mycobacterium sp.]
MIESEPVPLARFRGLAAFGGPKAVRQPVLLNWPPISEDLRAEIDKVLASGRLSINDGSGVIAEFERSFAAYCGSKWALSFCNGTASLHSALFAVGVRPGDEVIVPTLTWPATANAVLLCGAKPVFCDVDLHSMCLTPATIRPRVTPRTRAIVLVHLWGNPVGVDCCVALADDLAIPLIEDASHAHGARAAGKMVGTFGAVGCFSLQASKLLAAGEAGVAVTDSPDLYDEMLALGHFGGRIERDSKTSKFQAYAYTGLGPKYRPHPLAVAIAMSSLNSLNGWLATRNDRLAELRSRLADLPGLALPETVPGTSRGAYYGFRIRNNPAVTRIPTELLVRLLQEEGVDVSGEWYQLLHRQPLYAGATAFEAATKSPWPYATRWSARYDDGQFPSAVEITNTALAVNIPTLCAPDLIIDYSTAFHKVFEVLAGREDAVSEAARLSDAQPSF